MSFEDRVKHNIWDTDLDEVFKTIKECHGDDKFDMKADWLWIRNSRCKYISVRIDMRDGAFVLVDRAGERISLEHLKFQYKEGESIPKYPKDSKFDGLMLERARTALAEIVDRNVPGGAEAVFDIAQEALDAINEHLGEGC